MNYDSYWFTKDKDGKLQVNASTPGCGCCVEYFNPEWDHDSDYKTAPTLSELEAYARQLQEQANVFADKLKLYKEQTG